MKSSTNKPCQIINATLRFTDILAVFLKSRHHYSLTNRHLRLSQKHTKTMILGAFITARLTTGDYVSIYPHTQALGGRGKREPLFAHVLNFPDILENRHNVHLLLLHPHNFWQTMKSFWSFVPVPSSSLRHLSTSDTSLKKAQVATRLEVLIWLLPGKSVWYHCDHCVIDCKLAITYRE